MNPPVGGSCDTRMKRRSLTQRQQRLRTIDLDLVVDLDLGSGLHHGATEHTEKARRDQPRITRIDANQDEKAGRVRRGGVNGQRMGRGTARAPNRRRVEPGSQFPLDIPTPTAYTQVDIGGSAAASRNVPHDRVVRRSLRLLPRGDGVQPAQ